MPYAGLSVRSGVRETVLLDRQSLVFVGPRDRSVDELADLEPQQVDLAQPRPLSRRRARPAMRRSRSAAPERRAAGSRSVPAKSVERRRVVRRPTSRLWWAC